jgi:hypothetical protein
MYVWDKLERKERHKEGEVAGTLKADTERWAGLERQEGRWVSRRGRQLQHW